MGGLSLAGLGMLTAGAVLAYSGINDPVGGPVGVVTAVLQGKTPTPQVPTVVGGGGGAAAAGKFAAGVTPTFGSAASVLQVARSYLGVPYRLGGASRSGIDCSGLVLVAYRDGAGINLPHRATLQAARGQRVSRDQVRAADLVAWGVPGNYPHIALALDHDSVIEAPTWGIPTRISRLWERKVPGFGYPDIIRILA